MKAKSIWFCVNHVCVIKVGVELTHSTQLSQSFPHSLITESHISNLMDPIKPQPLVLRHVVAMPWPGRGHINPMLNLCKRLVRRDQNLIITVVVTEEWLGLIGSNPKPNRIHFATLPNVIPSELVRANDFIRFVDAVITRLEEPFEQLLDLLDSPPPTAIIADTYVIWAVNVGIRRNIPVASFWTTSATILSLFIHSDLLASHCHFPVELSGTIAKFLFCRKKMHKNLKGHFFFLIIIKVQSF